MGSRVDNYERSIIPLALFSEQTGVATGWFFAVPKAFREALDIKLDQRSFEKKRYKVITQGDAFFFKEGDMIYDTPLARSLPWGEALRHIKFAIQVQESEPAFRYSSQAQDGSSKVSYNQGVVRFELLRSDGDKLSVVRFFK
ncbi:MAG: hypothetical protein RBT63_10700, partial [Bdellovibrionales bacterium]|nr:hypothetical protein [Bdellovibrionales bacterium]